MVDSDAVLQLSTLHPVRSGFGYLGGLYTHDDRVWAVGGTTHRWPTLAVSADGAHFYRRQLPAASGLRDLAWTKDGRLLVVGEYGVLAESGDDGATWNDIELDTGVCLFSVVVDAEGAVWIGGDDGLLLRSADGATFSSVELETSSRVGHLAVIDGTVWIGCGDGSVCIATDAGPHRVTSLGSTVTAITKTTAGTILISGDGGMLARSTDGSSFELVDLGTGADIEDVAATVAGVLAIGADGLILNSTDEGQTFERVWYDDTPHLWSILPSGSGALIGGDDGLVLWLHAAADTTWVDRPDAIAAEPRPRDAEFEVDPDTYLTTLAAQLSPGRSGMAEQFEDLWGRPIPTELDNFVRLVEAGHLKHLYEWSTEADLFGIPTDRNSFEYVVKRDQKNYLGTGLPELFGGLVFVGMLGNGDSYQLSLASDDHPADPDPGLPRQLYAFDHETHDLDAPIAPTLSRFAYFSALCGAIESNAVSPAAARRTLTALEGTIAPPWHFQSTVKDALDGERLGERAAESQFAWVMSVRARWLIYLLRNDGVVGVNAIPEVFDERVNHPLTEEQHQRWLTGASTWPATLLYCLWRTFFFGDDAHLADYLEVARDSKSRLARDAGALIEEFQAGRKKLGSIKNIHKLRRRFQELDLDPDRAEERAAEAAAAAEALAQARADQRERVAQAVAAGTDLAELAWADLTNLALHEAIEEAFRADASLAPTFGVIDFALGQGWQREDLILSHERDQALEALEAFADARVLPLLFGSFVRAGEDADSDDGRITSGRWQSSYLALHAFLSGGHRDQRLLAPLRAELEIVPEEYETRREAAVELLGLLKDAASVPSLIALAEASDSDDFLASITLGSLNRDIAIALARIGDPAAVPILATLATAPVEAYEDAASHAAMALAQFGAVEHWQALLAAANGKQSTPASYIVWAVGKLGLVADEPTRAEIAAALRAFKPTHNAAALSVARRGMAAVLERNHPKASKQIHAGLSEQGWSDSGTNRLRIFACELAGIEHLDHPGLLALARRDHRGVREAAQAALAALGKPISPATTLNPAGLGSASIEELLVLLRDPDVVFKGFIPLALAERGDASARPGLRDYGLALIASAPADGPVDDDEVGYPLRWTLHALLALGESDELIELAIAALSHPSRDIRDPALRYAEQLPHSEALVLPMLRVKQDKWGWQESAATDWLASWIGTDAYRAAVQTLQS